MDWDILGAQGVCIWELGMRRGWGSPPEEMAVLLGLQENQSLRELAKSCCRQSKKPKAVKYLF